MGGAAVVPVKKRSNESLSSQAKSVAPFSCSVCRWCFVLFCLLLLICSGPFFFRWLSLNPLKWKKKKRSEEKVRCRDIRDLGWRRQDIPIRRLLRLLACERAASLPNQRPMRTSSSSSFPWSIKTTRDCEREHWKKSRVSSFSFFTQRRRRS